MISAESDETEEAYEELVDMTPDPMNSMLEKQPRTEAINKMLECKGMVVTNVPPTAGNTPQQSGPEYKLLLCVTRIKK